jgi:hypothetical protein
MYAFGVHYWRKLKEIEGNSSDFESMEPSSNVLMSLILMKNYSIFFHSRINSAENVSKMYRKSG